MYTDNHTRLRSDKTSAPPDMPILSGCVPLESRVGNMSQGLDLITVGPSRRFREAAYEAIKEAILDARLEGGEPLIEERLAEALGISRTPVREALAILE